MKRALFAIFLLTFIFSLTGVYAPTSGKINSCQTLDTSGTYVLTQDIKNYGGTCFTITANNVTLDGNGYTIDGDDSTGYGIYMTGMSNVTVKNIIVTDFDTGLFIDASSNNNLYNITANSNTNDGIFLSSSSNNNFSSITANSNSNDGISLFSSSNNNLFLITANSNLRGVYLSETSGNQLNNISVNSNTDGIVLSGSFQGLSNGNQLSNITANSNTHFSIYIDTSYNNNFSQGSINASGWDAIYLYDLQYYLDGGSFGNIFTNISITNTNLLFYDFNSATESINGTLLIDMPNVKNYSFTGAGEQSLLKKQV